MRNLFFVSLAIAASTVFAVSAFGQGNIPSLINGGVLNGKATSLPKPEYPELAKAAGIEGAISVEVLVDENGNVEMAAAAKDESDNNELSTEKTDAKAALREAARQAALEAKFAPTRLNGVPVKVKGIIVYNFRQGEASADRSMPGSVKVLNDKAIELPNPEYPSAAQAVRASGIVKVQVTIDETGTVIEAKVLSGHALLQSAAVEAARLAKFAPGKEGTKIIGVLTYNFVLPDKKP